MAVKGLALHGGLCSSAPPAPAGSGGTALLLRPPRLFLHSQDILGLILKKVELEVLDIELVEII